MVCCSLSFFCVFVFQAPHFNHFIGFEKKTGIDIETWLLPIFIPRLKRKEIVSLSVWDFAGQEIYYTTHQFFLSGIVFVHDSVFLFQFQ
jgi:GTPase SAR1 family protein